MSPCKRRDFLRKLKVLGFLGPYNASKHQFMVYENHRLAIPSNDEYSIPQLKILLKELEAILNKSISNKDWENL
jgi:hypothetical protein